MKATDLVDMLRAHYCPPNRQPSGLFAAEVQSPDGRRRADALWMPLVSSAGDELVGHEIKVSRSDVLVELQEPSKCDPWLRYCHRWWLVVASPDLLLGLWDDIPAAWGVLAPPSGRRKRSMTVLREAPNLRPENPAPAIQRLLAWSYYRQRDRELELTRTAENAERGYERVRQQIADLRDQGQAEITPQGRRALELLQAITRISEDRGARVWTEHLDLDLVAAAVLDRVTVDRATETTVRALEGVLGRLEDPLGYAKQHVQSALKTLGEHRAPGDR